MKTQIAVARKAYKFPRILTHSVTAEYAETCGAARIWKIFLKSIPVFVENFLFSFNEKKFTIREIQGSFFFLFEHQAQMIHGT